MNSDDVIKYSEKVVESTSFPFEIPEHPNALKLMKWYQETTEWANQQINTIEGQCAIKCTCKKGCAHCCKQAIPVCGAEVEILMKYIERYDVETRKSIYSKCCLITEKLNKVGMDTKLLNDTSKEKYIQQKYFELNVECPFLNNEKECMVYAVRPALCWTYRNYGAPQDCIKSYDVDSTIKYNNWEFVVFSRLMMAKRSNKSPLEFIPVAIKKSIEARFWF